MKKTKRIITESERQADLIKRQEAIKESFGKGMKLLGEDFDEDEFWANAKREREDLETNLKSAMIKVVDVEAVVNTFDTPQGATTSPFNLIYKAIKSNLISIDDVDERLIQSAMETAEYQDHPEGHGFGSSDMTYLLGDFLSDAGYKVDYSSGGMVVTKGGMNETDSNENDTYFETLSATLEHVRGAVEQMGYGLDEEGLNVQFGSGGVSYGQTKSANINLLKNGEEILSKNGKPLNRAVHISIYRMDSGRYELTMYKTF